MIRAHFGSQRLKTGHHPLPPGLGPHHRRGEDDPDLAARADPWLAGGSPSGLKAHAWLRRRIPVEKTAHGPGVLRVGHSCVPEGEAGRGGITRERCRRPTLTEGQAIKTSLERAGAAVRATGRRAWRKPGV
jgi:hypothetical protein